MAFPKQQRVGNPSVLQKERRNLLVRMDEEVYSLTLMKSTMCQIKTGFWVLFRFWFCSSCLF